MPIVRAVLPLALLLAPSVTRAADKVDFSRDIRPILSNHCFKCHGPATQKAKLRFDGRDHATKSGALVPGKPTDSEMMNRIAADDETRMPPPESGEKLTAEQIYAPGYLPEKPITP